MTAPLTRREFLKLAATTVASGAVMGGLPSLLTARAVRAFDGALLTSADDVIVPVTQ